MKRFALLLLNGFTFRDRFYVQAKDKDVADERKMASGGQDDCIDREDYFMLAAVLASKRSKDPNTKVGACIVDEDNKIVSIGYNGMPSGCNDGHFPWARGEGVEWQDSKKAYVCHAEMNAVTYMNSAKVKGCMIYVTLFPCNECAKIIIQSGIKKVVYCSDKYAYKKEYIASKKLLDMAEIPYEQFKPKDPGPISLEFPTSGQAEAPEGSSSTDLQSS